MLVDGEHLSIEDVVNVARYGEKVKIANKVKKKVEKARKTIEKILTENKPIYGVNTGFGELANVRISNNKIKELQKNLIRSHACGVGGALEEEIVRAMILLRLNSLAKGYSGVRYELLERLAEVLNKRFYPFVPSQGSVGASGDLIQLAHVVLALIGEGEAIYDGKFLPSKEVLDKLGIKPLELEAKEGLALINGCQFMTAILCLALYDAYNLLKNAQIAGAMSFEALGGIEDALRGEIAEARPYNGQMKASKNLLNLTRNSKIVRKNKVQDAYSLRCMPQVFGAFYEALNFVEKIASIEINSATDNPLIFDNEVLSGGNFHGEPVAISLDMLNIVLTKLSSFSERRIFRLLDEKLSGLPAFLAEEPGLNSGLMILQYTAASLVSENKSLSFPSVDSIPTSANQEDYQSMGSISALKCRRILRNAEKVIAIEFITACQALDFIEEEPSPAVKKAYEIIRKCVKKLTKDKPLYKEIEKVADLIHNQVILKEVEKIVKLE